MPARMAVLLAMEDELEAAKRPQITPISKQRQCISPDFESYLVLLVASLVENDWCSVFGSPSPANVARRILRFARGRPACVTAIAATGPSAMASTGVNLPRVFKMPLPFSFSSVTVSAVVLCKRVLRISIYIIHSIKKSVKAAEEGTAVIRRDTP